MTTSRKHFPWRIHVKEAPSAAPPSSTTPFVATPINPHPSGWSQLKQLLITAIGDVLQISVMAFNRSLSIPLTFLERVVNGGMRSIVLIVMLIVGFILPMHSYHTNGVMRRFVAFADSKISAETITPASAAHDYARVIRELADERATTRRLTPERGEAQQELARQQGIAGTATQELVSCHASLVGTMSRADCLSTINAWQEAFRHASQTPR